MLGKKSVGRFVGSLGFGCGRGLANPVDADQIYMDPDAERGQRGKDRRMNGVKPRQGQPGHRFTCQQYPGDQPTDNGYVSGNVRADHRSPEGFLVPGKQVSREPEPESEQKQAHAQYPGYLPRGFKSPGKKACRQMGQDQNNHGACSPVVNPPEDFAHCHLFHDEIHGRIGKIRRRVVVHGQKHSRQGFDDEQQRENAPQRDQPAQILREGLFHERLQIFRPSETVGYKRSHARHVIPPPQTRRPPGL